MLIREEKKAYHNRTDKWGCTNNNTLFFRRLIIYRYYNITHFRNFRSVFWQNEKGILLLSAKGRRLAKGRFQKNLYRRDRDGLRRTRFFAYMQHITRESATSSLHISTHRKKLNFPIQRPPNSLPSLARTRARVLSLLTVEYIFLIVQHNCKIYLSILHSEFIKDKFFDKYIL